MNIYPELHFILHQLSAGNLPAEHSILQPVYFAGVGTACTTETTIGQVKNVQVIIILNLSRVIYYAYPPCCC